MTEKLLSRPPFKYLFDVVVALQKSTQFAEGLYSEAKLDANAYAVGYARAKCSNRIKNQRPNSYKK